MKRLFVYAFAALCVLPLSAQTLQSGSYACNGTAYTLQITSLFGTGGAATLYEYNNIVSNATIKVIGGNIAFTFFTGGAKYQGKTWIYKISGDASFEGNGETWLKTADFRYPFPSPASPAPGSITNPAPQPPEREHDAPPALKSGSYSMSGAKQRIYLNIEGRRGRGTLFDENGSIAGEFTAAVNGSMLSLTFHSGRQNGVTYDYRITGDTSFSRPGEMWIRRY